ncbi:MAG: rRNA pseudouridine synthase [Sphingomonadales bacterium]|nr:rRNA pseudouridine synthase [Sphingomonadales bacterium]
MTDSPEAPSPVSATPERVAKVIARSGVASRRDAEKMILAGRVAVNGKKIDSPAIDVSPKDRVTIDGQPIDAPQETRVWLYYKPLGLVTTEKDEQGRRTIFDEMPEGMPRVLNVGRLDLNSEGLLLLTNDGGLKRRLELPETGWLRKYRVRVNGRPMADTFDPLRRGITIEGEEFQPMEIRLDRQQGANAWLTVGIREGKNREIRRAMAEIGLTVNRLIRISYGPFRLNDMKPGDVVEVKRKVLREQMGDRLLLGVEDGRKSRTEREEAALAARAERFARSDARRDGGRPERGAREDCGDRKGFGKQRDFGSDRGECGFKPRREDGDRPFKPRREDGERGEFRPKREDGERGAKPFGAKPFGGKPRAAGFKSHRDEDGGGERRSFGDKKPYAPRDGGREGGFGGKPFGGKPRGEGFRGDRPRDDRPRDDRPREDRPRDDRPREDRPRRDFKGSDFKGGDFKGGKPFGAKRFDGDRPERGERPYTPRGDKPYGDKPRGAEGGFGDKKPYGARGDKPFARRDGDKPYGDKPRGDKPFGERSGKPYAPRQGGRDGKPGGGFKSQGFKSHGGKPGAKPRAEGSKSHGGRAMTGFNRGPAKPRKD